MHQSGYPMDKQPKPHGGVRKGAGRKPAPEPSKRINVYLPESVITALKRIHPSVSRSIRLLVEKESEK
jgi:hypothetical protein